MDEDLMLAMEKLRETINRKVVAGAVEEARRIVSMTRHATEMMPEGYYKMKSLEFLNQEFGSLWGSSNSNHSNMTPAIVAPLDVGNQS